MCDQSFITSVLLNDIIKKQQETAKPIVAGSYENTPGTPVLFFQTLSLELIALQGDAGAKKIILQHPGDAVTVLFTMGDIDTDADDAALKDI